MDFTEEDLYSFMHITVSYPVSCVESRACPDVGGATAVLFGDVILEAAVLIVGAIAILFLAPFAWIAVVHQD